MSNYRIIKKEASVGIYRVKDVNEDGVVDYEVSPELQAKNMRELHRKVIEINEAFWEPILTETVKVV